MATNIEISKEGLKFPYDRFLADSAIGYIIILLSIVAYFYPILGSPLKENLRVVTSTEIKVFILLLLFFLATPLGLLTNAVSWISVGWLTDRLEPVFYKERPFFVDTIDKTIFADGISPFFGLSTKPWIKTSLLIQEVMDIYYRDLVAALDYARGAKVFFRNIAFLCLCFALAFPVRFVMLKMQFTNLFQLLLFYVSAIVLISSFLYKTTGKKYLNALRVISGIVLSAVIIWVALSNNLKFNTMPKSLPLVVLLFSLFLINIVIATAISFHHASGLFLRCYLVYQRYKSTEGVDATNISGNPELIVEWLSEVANHINKKGESSEKSYGGTA
jgi:hypothetical protein